MLLVLHEERERVRGLGMRQVHVGVARPTCTWNTRSCSFAISNARAAGSPAPAWRAPASHATRRRASARTPPPHPMPRVRDVQTGPVGDDRLVPDQPWVVPAACASVLERPTVSVERSCPRALTIQGSIRPTRCTGTPPSAVLEFGPRDRGLRVSLVGHHRDHLLRLQQPRHVAGRIGAKGGVAGRHHRVLRGLAPEVLGEPPAERQPEHRRLGELLRERGELEVRVVRGDQRRPQEHASRLERARFPLEQILGPERVTVRVDDVGAGRSTLHRSVLLGPRPRSSTAIAGARISLLVVQPCVLRASPRRVARNVSNRKSPIASRSTSECAQPFRRLREGRWQLFDPPLPP